LATAGAAAEAQPIVTAIIRLGYNPKARRMGKAAETGE
jgi:hypothetical protein